MGMRRRRLALMMALTLTMSNVESVMTTAFAEQYYPEEDVILEEEVDGAYEEHGAVYEEETAAEAEDVSTGDLIDAQEAATEGELVDGLSLETIEEETEKSLEPESETEEQLEPETETEHREIKDFTVTCRQDGHTYPERMEDIYEDSEEREIALAEVVYANGTSDTVYFWLDESESWDNYENKFELLIERNGEAYALESTADLLVGNYSVYVKFGEVKKLAGSFTVEPVQAENIVVDQDKLVENISRSVFLSFKTGKEGNYRISTDVQPERIELYDADLKEIEESWGRRSLQTELEAESTYYVRIYLENDANSASLRVEQIPAITDITVKTLAEELIAGIDRISNYLRASILYSDATQNSDMSSGEEDAYEHSVRFYTQDDEGYVNGFISDEHPLKAGEYDIYAGIGHFVSSSAVVDQGGKTPVKVKVTLPKAEDQKQLTLDQEEQVSGDVARRLYGFKAPKDGSYTTKMISGNAHNAFYYSDGERLICLGSSVELNKDETVILAVEAKMDGVFSVVEVTGQETDTGFTEHKPKNIKIGENYTIRAEARKEFYYDFTPNRDGYYGFDFTVKSGEMSFNIIDGQVSYGAADVQEGRKTNVDTYLIAGTTYELCLEHWGESNEYDFVISYLGDKTEKIADVTVIEPKEKWTAFNNDCQLPVKLTYDNGRSMTYYIGLNGIHESSAASECNDLYLNMISASELIQTGETDKTITYQYTLTVTSEDEKTIIRQENRSVTYYKETAYDEVKIGETSYTVDQNHASLQYYRFVPEKTDNYEFHPVNGANICILDAETGYCDNRGWASGNNLVFNLEGGKTYFVEVEPWNHWDEDDTAQTGIFRITRLNPVTSVKITKMPNEMSIVPHVKQPDLTGLEVTVSYAEGAPKTYTYGTEEWWDLRTTYQKVNDTRMQVEITADMRSTKLYLTIDEKLVDTLPKIELGKEHNVTKLATFTPGITGTYEFSGVDAEYEGIPIVDYTVRDSRGENPGYTGTMHTNHYYFLTKGETYTIENLMAPADFNLTIQYVGACQWDVVSEKDATCTETGERVEKCSIHGDTRTTVLSAKGHQWGAEQTKDPTAAEDGEVYQICDICGEKLVVKVLSKLGVDESIEQAAKDLETKDPLTVIGELNTLSSSDIANSDGGMELVEKLEEKLIQQESVKLGDGDDTAEVSLQKPVTGTDDTTKALAADVEGAAVTVTKALQESENKVEEGATYSARLELTNGQMLTDEASKQVYQLDISLYLVKKDADGREEKLSDTPQQLLAPIRITMSIPEDLAGSNDLELYHLEADGRKTRTPYEIVEDGRKISFIAASLSEWQLTRTLCADSSHSMVKTGEKVDATCKDTGYETYKCSNCGFTEEKTLTVDPKNHVHVVHADRAEATCQTEGSIEHWTCSDCGKSFADQACIEALSDDELLLAKKEHTMVTDPAVAATCTVPGKTEGKHCAVCGTVFTPQTATAISGHQFGAWQTVSEATVFGAEQQSRRCGVCGHEETRTIGGAIPATMITNAAGNKIALKTGQATTGLRITGLAKGDSIESITINNPKAVALSAVNTAAGTCRLKAKKLTGKKGKAVLTIRLSSGLTRAITISVQKGDVKTKKVTVPERTITLKKGQSYRIVPVIEPFTSKDKLSFTVKDKKTATVSKKGVVKAKKPGKTKITVKAGKKKVVVNVIVTK